MAMNQPITSSDVLFALACFEQESGLLGILASSCITGTEMLREIKTKVGRERFVPFLKLLMALKLTSDETGNDAIIDVVFSELSRNMPPRKK